ncbi:MAG: GAF domain-containing protein [Candidatus Sumerlaeaceae bacterium]
MGWFDKKSWQLRRKIKDLQADLKEAERDGKYVVEQGLFFAELEDMGEMTMMVFGTADHMASQEESVIKTFFDRNGFTVETLKLDKDQTSVAEVEIIPSEEMTRHVGRLLKGEGYRIIDDSEREKAPNLPEKIIPLSSLVRGMIILFATQVQQVISTSNVKMNKEGNRLLHWMPKLVETLGRKVKPEVLDILRPSFEDAYEAFYGRVGKLGEVAPRAVDSERAVTATSQAAERIPSLSFPAASKPSSTSSTATAAPPRSAATAAGPFAPAAPVPAPKTPPPAWASAPTPHPRAASSVNAPALDEAVRARDTAETAAKMYRSLIGAISNRCVRNSEVLLDDVNRLFKATATCLMVRAPQGDGFTIHANAGKRLTWGEGGGEGFPVSSTVLTRCLQQRTAVSNEMGSGDPSESMVMHQIEAAAAAPILVKDSIVGILYVDRRANPVPFDQQDCDSLLRLSDVFREFPDLVLGHLAE